MITFDQDERDQDLSLASIKVVGIGGAGGNTINCMVDSNFKGVEFVAINTDAQALKNSKAHHAIQIGQKSTKGLGAGANPDVGKRSAEEDIDKVLDALQDADIVFVSGGMGGGTGSGALPVIVKALKEKGILTIVVVTKPFAFEGKKRSRVADEAIEVVKKYADTLLVIPNQKLLDLVDDKVSMIDGFEMINEVLNHSVRGISDIITRAGHINVDFADVKEIMKDKGLAVMGTARASGEGRAKKATLQAISSPLLENMNIAGARGVLLNITGGPDLGLHEISQAASIIYEQADQDANIILGSVIDRDMKDEVSVTIIATGFVPARKDVVLAAKEEPLLVAAPLVQPPVVRPTQVEQVFHAAPVAVASVAQVVHVEKQEEPRSCELPPVVPAVEPQKIQETSCKLAQQEADVIYVAPAVQPAPVQTPEPMVAKEVAPVLAHKEQSTHQTIATPSGAVNLHDLDVPTFMRKQHQQKPKND